MEAKGDERIIANPGIAFRKDVEDHKYDDMPDDIFATLLDDVKQESGLFFRDKRCASINVLFLRAFTSMELTDKELHLLIKVFSSALARAELGNENRHQL